MTTNQFELPEGSDGPTPLDAEHVESLLRGHRPADAPPGADRVADAMHALTGPGAPSELTGYREAMASYGDAFATRTGLRPRRLVLVSSVLGIRALAGAAGAALAAGAVGAVVLASTTLGPAHAPQSLPVGTGSTTSTATATHTADDEADDQADDQDEQETSEGSGSSNAAVGPDAKGPAAFGLCNAWSHHPTTASTGTATTDTSVAFRNLAKAAGGEAKIAAYCATVPHPGAGKGVGATNKAKGKSKDKASTETKRHGAPATRPGTAPSARPTAKPSHTTPPARGRNGSGRPSTTPPVPTSAGPSTS